MTSAKIEIFIPALFQSFHKTPDKTDKFISKTDKMDKKFCPPLICSSYYIPRDLYKNF